MEAFFRAGGLPEYYQCEIANKSAEDWYLEGKQDIAHGTFCIMFGILCQFLYIPCMIVFTQNDLICLPVYKLMFFICMCDLINLTTNGLLTGLFFIEGAVFCHHPAFMYIWGCIEMSGWSGCCIGCFFLVLTRLVDLISPELHELAFAGKRICFSFGIMGTYMLYFLMYVKPIVFNSTWMTWLFDPMIHNDGRDYAQYGCLITVLNNSGTVGSTLIMYLLFFMVFTYKMKRSYDFKMDKKQKQILVQSCMICLNNLVLALLYVSYQYIEVGPLTTLAGLITWQLSSSGGIFVFYVMNTTVRRRVFILVGLRRFAYETTSAVAPSNQHNKSVNTNSVKFH